MRPATFFLIAAVLVAGCTRTSGRDFTVPIETQFVPGQTTIANLKTTLGEPDTQTSYTSSGGTAPPKQPESEFASPIATVPGTYDTLYYRFVKANTPAGGGDVFVKLAAFVFRDGVLIGYSSQSNFADHPTDFDTTKTSLLRKGQSTRQDVEAILGPATGQAIYPIVLKPGESTLQYNYGTLDPHTRKILSKALVLLFDADGRLLDYRSNTTVSNAPAQPAPAITPVPVIIPAHK